MNLPNDIVKTFSQFKNSIFNIGYELKYKKCYIYIKYSKLIQYLLFFRKRWPFGIVIEVRDWQNILTIIKLPKTDRYENETKKI